MKTTNIRADRSNGGFLLEALIGVLIFSFGILGIVGLQAHRCAIPATPSTAPKRCTSPIR